MKAKYQVVALITLLFFGWSCSENKTSSNTTVSDQIEEGAVISFDKTVHEFGRIESGERVAYAFRFENKGQTPLIITGVRTGCGCTVGDYPKDPIAPGQTGRINVIFNSSGKRGFQSEAVTVLSNDKSSPTIVRVTAEVINI